MELRNPNKSHYPLVLALLERCFPVAWQPQALADRIYYDPHYDPSHVWMAREQGKVLGFLVTTLDGDKAFLKLLAVDPDARRQGLATDMLSRAEYRLSGEGAHEMLVESTPPFGFLPGVKVGSAAESFFGARGYDARPAELYWLPEGGAELTAPPSLDKAAALAFARDRSGPSFPWVEETLNSQPPRMVYLPGDGLILAEPGLSVGPAWIDPRSDRPYDSAGRLIAAARAIAQGIPVVDPMGLQFIKLPSSDHAPRSALKYDAPQHLHFRKTLA